MSDRYEIVNLLRKDTLGAAYLAEDSVLGRQVVVRYLEHGANPEGEAQDDSYRKNLVTHAGKLCAMQHPNMLTVYDISTEENGILVVTQVVKGKSLAERLKEGALNQVGVYQMGVDMLEALHACHDAGVFHGDLHTGSIERVDRNSGGHRYLLVDLGLNRLASMVKAGEVNAADPVMVAPELHQKDKEPDAKADLFMLGQLCYIALVGGHPFSEKTAEECLAIYNEEGMPLLEKYVENIDPALASWVMSLLECNPDNRPQDTGEALASLLSIQLSDPKPNVPGKTQAVAERDRLLAYKSGAAAEKETESGSLSFPSADSATNKEGVIKFTGNPTVLSPTTASEQKKNKPMVLALISVGLLLLGGVIITLLAKGRENEVASEDVSASAKDDIKITEVTGVESIKIGSSKRVKLSAQQSINLDGKESLDWLVTTRVPSPSKHASKKDGQYIESLRLIAVKKEKMMRGGLFRFESGGKKLQGKAITGNGTGSNLGAGYKVNLSIPAQEKQSITVNLFMVQYHCDLRVEVMGSASESKAVKIIPYTLLGGYKIPVHIDHPKGGNSYLIKVTAVSKSKKGVFSIGLSGVQVEGRP